MLSAFPSLFYCTCIITLRKLVLFTFYWRENEGLDKLNRQSPTFLASGTVFCRRWGWRGQPDMGGRAQVSSLAHLLWMVGHRKWGGAQVSFAPGLGAPELSILSKVTELISGRTGI